jgi:hypothetical protein
MRVGRKANIESRVRSLSVHAYIAREGGASMAGWPLGVYPIGRVVARGAHSATLA